MVSVRNWEHYFILPQFHCFCIVSCNCGESPHVSHRDGGSIFKVRGLKSNDQISIAYNPYLACRHVTCPMYVGFRPTVLASSFCITIKIFDVVKNIFWKKILYGILHHRFKLVCVRRLQNAWITEWLYKLFLVSYVYGTAEPILSPATENDGLTVKV